jgi:biotin operon repressor
MSYPALWVAKNVRSGNVVSQCILYVIGAHAHNETGGCFLGLDTIAREAQCTRRAVQLHIKKLSEDGLLTFTRSGKGYQFTITKYKEHADSAPKTEAKPYLTEHLTQPEVANEVRDNAPIANDVRRSVHGAANDVHPNSIVKINSIESCSKRSDAASTPSSGRGSSDQEKLEPSSNDTSLRASGIDLNKFSIQLEEAAKPCLDNPVNCQSLVNLQVPLSWIAAGCSVELDILPALTAIGRTRAGKRVRSWSYFTQAVHEARDRRLSGKSSGQTHNAGLLSLPTPKPGHEWKKGLCRHTGKLKWVQQRIQEPAQ